VTGIARGPSGALYVSEIQSGAVWKVDRDRRVSRLARAPRRRSWHSSVPRSTSAASSRACNAIDVRTARRRLLVSTPGVHGITVAGGRLYAATGDSIVQVDLPLGTISARLALDAGKPAVGADGTLYLTRGDPNGGTVERLETDGSTTTVVGNGGIGPDRDSLRQRASAC